MPLNRREIKAMAETSFSSKMAKLGAVKGMNDILPPDSAIWEWLEEKIRRLMAQYAYRNIRTPILEHTALFIRGIGEVTDIVEKEMYSFDDRLNGEALTLRPENTASVVRAAVEHSMLYDGGKRLYYMGPMFRHERPQRGRYRQFHQVGAEALGFSGAEVDAELILLASALWNELGLKDVRLEINCLGQPTERAAHRADLIAYFQEHSDQLDEDARRRLQTNPLRILDTKNPLMKEVVESAPLLLDYLGESSLLHFDALKKILDESRISYSVNPRLVRGLDYYNLSVFEFVTDRLGAQGTVCAGGRYDHLIEQIGGKPAPAVGWALGVERVLELLREMGSLPVPMVPDAYAVVPDPESLPFVMRCLQAVRAEGISVQMHASTASGMGSMKAQFKRADVSGARFALVFGQEEIAANAVTVKPLRAPGREQVRQPLTDIGQWAHTLQSNE
jgi:histidyl-tRNA synthetase